jgi:lysophospholipase L1-like esterase
VAGVSERCRLGLIALGDSITKGDGEPALGVWSRSWSLWLAQALELPHTNLAVDGALACELARDQLPRVRADYDLACAYIGVNDARGPDWDPPAFAAALDATLAHLGGHAARVLTCTIPLDLGRPRTGAPVPVANALIRRLAGEHDAVCAELADLHGWRLLLPDAVHPTALGQLEIADRAAGALTAAGVPVSRLPSVLAQPRRGRRPEARFAARWARLLARDLVRRRLEGVRLGG